MRDFSVFGLCDDNLRISNVWPVERIGILINKIKSNRAHAADFRTALIRLKCFNRIGVNIASLDIRINVASPTRSIRIHTSYISASKAHNIFAPNGGKEGLVRQVPYRCAITCGAPSPLRYVELRSHHPAR